MKRFRRSIMSLLGKDEDINEGPALFRIRGVNDAVEPHRTIAAILQRSYVPTVFRVSLCPDGDMTQIATVFCDSWLYKKGLMSSVEEATERLGTYGHEAVIDDRFENIALLQMPNDPVIE